MLLPTMATGEAGTNVGDPLCLLHTRDGYNGGVGPARTPPQPPPLVTKKVTIFGHKKRDPQLAVLGSPLPVHVHGRGGR